MKILFLIAIGLLLYVIVNTMFRRRQLSQSTTQKTENMVQCHQCGLHILEQEAICDGTFFYCSQEHQEADK